MSKPDFSVTPDATTAEGGCILHASCVAFGTSAVLITGVSGAGKSSLALGLMALGAMLVSDDKTCLNNTQSGLLATAPASIKGMIEARGIGILTAEACPSAIVRLLVNLDRDETERLPPQHTQNILGQTLPVLHNVKAPHFAAAIVQYLKGGRIA